MAEGVAPGDTSSVIDSGIPLSGSAEHPTRLVEACVRRVVIIDMYNVSGGYGARGWHILFQNVNNMDNDMSLYLDVIQCYKHFVKYLIACVTISSK